MAERKTRTSDIVEIVLLYEWRMGIKKESSNGGVGRGAQKDLK